MVRLKAGTLSACMLNRIGFNSTMVRLKGETVDAWHVTDTRFNSTMVRLKVYLVGLIAMTSLVFQFHNGSIKSESLRHRFSLKRVVSIPQWFD